MNKKRKVFKLGIMYLSFLILLLVLGACGQKISETNNGGDSDNGKDNKNISIGAGPNGSANYITVSGMASLISDYNISTEISNGSQENIRMIQEGTSQFGIAMTDALYNAYEGTREFDEDTKESINIVMGGPQTLLHFMVPKKSDIDNISDLKGKSIGVSQGVTSQYYVPTVLEAYGIADDVKTKELELPDIQNALKDGTIDAGIHITPFPNTTIQDLAATTEIKLLEIDNEIAEEIIEENPYFETGEIPGDTYRGFEEDITTLGARNILIVDSELDEEIVYDFTKSIIEGHDELLSIHPQAGDFNEENALQGDVIPVHPGAKKYYEEKGILE